MNVFIMSAGIIDWPIIYITVLVTNYMRGYTI